MTLSELSKLSKLALATALIGSTAISGAHAFGEAGPILLREMGGFLVGVTAEGPNAEGHYNISGQSYVEFGLTAEPKLPHSVILVHGGGGQSSDWFSTVDGRDGWRSYLLAAGIDTYWIDRPGLGRSPSNPNYGPENARGVVGGSNYPLISGLASSKLWPDAKPIEGEWDRAAWTAANQGNQGVINWVASSPAGPYGGNDLARKNILELLEKVGPSVLFAHSAGVASTLQATLAAPAGAVKGLLIFEGGVNLYDQNTLGHAQFEPALAADFAPVDVDGCLLQPEGAVSKLANLADTPVTIIRSQYGNQTDAQFTCAVRQLEQAGVEAKFIQMNDIGFPDGGHFMMSDTNSGEIATDVLVPVIAALQGAGELPAEWTITAD